MPALLTRLKINRVAAVDRGAGEGVKVLLWKRDSGSPDMTTKTEATITEAAAKAMLKKHVQSFAKSAGDNPAAMIEAVAKINSAVAGLDRSICTIANDAAVTAKAAEIKKSVDQFTAHLAELGHGEVGKLLAADIVSAHPLIAKGDRDMALPQNEADIQKMIDDALAKSTKPLTDTIAVLKYDNAVLKLTPAQKAYHDGLATDDLKKEWATKPDAEKEKDVEDKAKKNALPAELTKALEPVLKSNEELTKRNTELEKTVGSMVERDAIASFAKRATDLSLPVAHGEVMRKAYAGDPAAIAAHEAALKGLVEQARTGKLFSEFGKAGNAAGSAEEQLNALAKEYMKTADGKGLSFQQAFTKVYTSPENRDVADLYKRQDFAKKHNQTVPAA